MGADIFILVIVAILVSGAVCLFTLSALLIIHERDEARRMKNIILIERYKNGCPEKPDNHKASHV